MATDLFDTHCHLNLEESFPDPEPFFQAAADAGVTRLALVGLDPSSGRRALDLAQSHDGTYAIVGRHPNYSKEFEISELDVYKGMLRHPKAIALGEIGLDYHWNFATREEQEFCLLAQLDLAAEVGVPVVFHSRDAYPDLLDILEKRPPHPYLFHCFAGDHVDLQRALDLGAYLGFDGPLTYKKNDELRAMVAALPRDRVVLETDSPYLSPVPVRGKPNQPAHLEYVNRILASVWELSEQQTAQQTTANALRYFGLE
jgi:TatD DNase family protein